MFIARPSPFYILDEVEAALDDTNLGRLLEIYEELRASSQLLVITHQKRTMEIADALYGVTMRGDGVSAVISQRLRETESRRLSPGVGDRSRRGARHHVTKSIGASLGPAAAGVLETRLVETSRSELLRPREPPPR